MKVTPTRLKDCFVLEPKVFTDSRGGFMETYNQRDFQKALGHEVNFVQDNLSHSVIGVLRGLHFQKGLFAQAKLIQVLKGEILDVIVDLRKDSRTFGKHVKFRMKDTDNRLIFIPKGMAHGFLTLSEQVLFAYKCDGYYNIDAEGGIAYNDPDLEINWEYPAEDIILSEKDRAQPSFRSLRL